MSDLIRRQDAIDVVAKLYKYESDRMTALQELPTVEAKPVVHGKWLEIEEKGLFDGEIYNATPRYKCSVCGNEAIKSEKEYRGHGECYVELTWFATDFCPSCGTDMRGGVDG